MMGLKDFLILSNALNIRLSRKLITQSYGDCFREYTNKWQKSPKLMDNYRNKKISQNKKKKKTSQWKEHVKTNKITKSINIYLRKLKEFKNSLLTKCC